MINISFMLFIGLAISASASYVQNMETVSEQLERSRSLAVMDSTPSLQNDEIYIRGDHIIVYQDEVDRIAKKYAISGVQDGEERAAHFLIRREALYHAGTAAGFTASDEEVNDQIRTSEEMTQDADGREYFDAYLEAARMTEHEYWEGQAAQLKKEIVIGKYLANLHDTNHISAEDWADYEANLVSDILQEDGIVMP